MLDFFIQCQQIVLENGQCVDLKYYMTMMATRNQQAIYGIKIEKLGEEVEIEDTGPISESKELVLELCNKIAKHQVTPIGLINIVDDIMTVQF